MKKNTTWRTRVRRTLAVTTSAALAGGLALAGAGSAAAADPAYDVTGGSGQWGVKASFRNYVQMPFVHGETTVTPPATTLDDGTFGFEATGGTVSGTTAEIELAGEVAFAGHDLGDGPVLEMAFADPRVLIDGDVGTLVADVVSREFIDTQTRGELVEYPQVELGEIDLSDAPLTVADGVASVTGAPVTLTAAGVPAFGTFYEEGAELDPVSFSVEIAPAAVAPTVTTQPQDVSVDEGTDAVFVAVAGGTPEPAVQWQTRTDDRAEWSDVEGATATELTLPAVTAEQDDTQVRAVFANGTEPDAVTEPATLTVVPAPQEWQPAIEVLAADGVTPLGDAEVSYGDTVVVRGTGFDPQGNVGGRGVPIPADLPQGTYVVFGKFADDWRPSAGADSAARVIGSQQWALAEGVLGQVPEQFQGVIREQWVDIAEDGSFTAELEITEPGEDRQGNAVEWPAEGTFGVYTYGAGGVSNADQELSVPVNLVEDPAEQPEAPELTVTPTEDLAVDTVITVEGTGYAPDRAISVAFTADTVKHEEYGWPVGWLNHEVVTTDENGEFTRELTVSGWVTGTGEDCSEVQCYLATFNSAQVDDAVPVDHRAERDQDAFVPVSFVAGYPEPTTPSVSATPNPVRQGQDLTVTGSDLPAGTAVTAVLEPSADPASGTLSWGVKESFRSYVTGPVAQGQITAGEDVVEQEDGTFAFPAESAAFADGGGTVTFAGSVSFTGHEMAGVAALEIHVANLRVQLSEDEAALLADVTSREFVGTTSAGELVDHPDVVLAELDRDAFTVAGEGLTADATAATLSGAGQPAFGTFYEAGTALDPVSVDVSTAQAVPAALRFGVAADTGTVLGTGHVGDDGSFEATWPVPGDVPVGGYQLVLRDDAGSVLTGEALTVLAAAVDDGDDEQPTDPDVPTQGSVAVDPDPVRQGATATILGTDLAPGTKVGAVIDGAGELGTLEWGVKESFRSYIAGQIANGEVSTEAPASETGEGGYLFGAGSGSGDPQDATADFAGTVTFTGHEMNGVDALEVRISAPTVVIADGAGHLVADVTSRSLDGAELVDYPGVRLAELDLAAGEVAVVDGRLTGTDVPATLTAAGAPAFADFYEAGTELDPVTFSVPVGDAALDLAALDVAETTVGEDGTVELTWQVPADLTPGTHRVDLVTEGESVADTTVTVVPAGSGAGQGEQDDETGGAPVDASGGDTLPTTGGETAALTALAAAVVLLGTLLVARRGLHA